MWRFRRPPRATPACRWGSKRFPPLAELVKTWSFEQIRAQVGAPVGPKVVEPAFIASRTDGDLQVVSSDTRDWVLITELARRGLTAQQVVELLGDVKPPRLFDRLVVIEEALRRGGKGPAPETYFPQAMELCRQIGKPADRAVSTLYRIVARKCPAAGEAEALKDLKQGVFMEGPLTYVGACSRSMDTLGMLEQLSGPQDLRNVKDLEVDDIRRRLRLPLKNPGLPDNHPDEDGGE